MTFYIQDPKSATTPYLHEALLEKCQDAISGGGAFAFVTKDGAELLLRDEIFVNFLSRHNFDLIVGVDETTNVVALRSLAVLRDEFPGLTVNVFHHDVPKAIFHPKFCWFRHKQGGYLITGSGNLTRRGLRGNWEAYTVTDLLPEELDVVEQKWTDWTQLHTNWLKPPDDEKVIARAALNIWKPKTTGKASTEAQDQQTTDSDAIASDMVQQSDAVLVAEISKGSNRWQQANFHRQVFQDFFGVQAGTVSRILLQHIDNQGTASSLETRPSVSVKSINFRFELGAAAGLAYPNQGPPIAVFVKTATRTFVYQLLMPSDLHHQDMEAFLALKWTGRSDHMRQIITNVGELRQYWPSSPLWQADLNSDN